MVLKNHIIKNKKKVDLIICVLMAAVRALKIPKKSSNRSDF